MVCIRGAITSDNTKEDIIKKTKRLLVEIMEQNDVAVADILQIQFTATKDLDQVYPAVAARELGVTQAALMCMQELSIVGSLEKCIRVMVMAENGKKQAEAIHIYLDGAEKLRPDLKRQP